MELCSLTGHALDVKGETELMEDQGGSVKVIVVDGLPHAAILGVEVLGQEAIINFEEQNLKCGHNDYPLQNYVSTQSHIESLGPSTPTIKELELSITGPLPTIQQGMDAQIFNRTLKTMISKLVNKRDEWEDLIRHSTVCLQLNLYHNWSYTFLPNVWPES